MQMKKDTEPKMIQSTDNKDRVYNDRPTQSTANKTLNKKELCKHNIRKTRS